MSLLSAYLQSQSKIAIQLYEQGSYVEAQDKLLSMNQLYPNSPEILATLGVVYGRQNDFQQAVECLKKAIQFKPDPRFYSNLSNIYKQMNDYRRAFAAVGKAIEIDPKLAGAWVNLGVIHSDLWQFDSAEQSYLKAITIDPNCVEAHFNLGCLKLLQGDYSTQSWLEYEWRLLTPDNLKLIPPFPRWAGQLLKDKRLLIRCEQGFGDTFQFVRYIFFLIEQGALITFICQPALKDILKIIFPDIQLFATNEILGEDFPQEYDYYTELLSVPKFFKSIPNVVPYITMGDIATIPKSIGIVWAGNAKHANDLERSLSNNELSFLIQELKTIPDISIYSFQMERSNPQLISDLHIQDYKPLIKNWIDTAYLISQMEVIVTVDTAIAHLASAMGKDVRILLPQRGIDWRWGLEGKDSVWYPIANLYRKNGSSNRNGWSDAFAELIRDLKDVYR